MPESACGDECCIVKRGQRHNPPRPARALHPSSPRCPKPGRVFPTPAPRASQLSPFLHRNCRAALSPLSVPETCGFAPQRRLQPALKAAARAAQRQPLQQSTVQTLAARAASSSYVLLVAAQRLRRAPRTAGHRAAQNPDAFALRRRVQPPKRLILASALPLCAARAFGSGNLRLRARAARPACTRSCSSSSAVQTIAALAAATRRPRGHRHHHANRKQRN